MLMFRRLLKTALEARSHPQLTACLETTDYGSIPGPAVHTDVPAILPNIL